MHKIENVMYCKVDNALSIISEKWTPTMLLTLIHNRPMRYSELKRELASITPKMLSSQLRELEMEGLINRQEFPEIPPKVVYSMTEYGMTIEAILSQLHDWGIRHLSR